MSCETLKFKLGNTLVDRVTGVKGITTGYITYLNGCRQWNIHPKAGKDGKVAETYWHDEQQLEFVDDGIAPKMEAEKKEAIAKKQSRPGGAPSTVKESL